MRYHTLQQKQKGISLSGLLVWAVILILVSISGLRVAPAYIEFSSIQRNLAAIVKNIDTQSTSPSQIKILFDKRAQIDNIKSDNGQDIKFNKEKDTVIPDEAVNLVEFAPMVNMKAKGKKLTSYKVKEINLRVSGEIEMDDYEEEDENIGENGMSPMELHRRAMEKLDPNNFKGKDGQINFEF